MNYKKFLLLAACSFLFNVSFSQSFAEGYSYLAKGKESQVTLINGETYDGNIDDADWKKGVYEGITFKDKDGKMHEWKASDIKQMYGYPGGLAKLGKQREVVTNLKKITDKNYNYDYIGKGMILFEQTNVIMGKKQYTLLMQLMNPDFCSVIKVYRDPKQKETARIGIGDLTVQGGDLRTYYVQKGDEPAFLAEKKRYKDVFKRLFGDNASMMASYGEKPEWLDFAKHIVEYSKAK